jgi:hypothetical protein
MPPDEVAQALALILARLDRMESEQIRQGDTLCDLSEAITGPVNGSRPGIHAELTHLKTQVAEQGRKLAALEAAESRARAVALGLGATGSALAQAVAALTGLGPTPK